jgi:uncharacterized protein
MPERIARRLRLRLPQVASAVELFEAGGTVPFVARYRKEVTGGLDEEQLRSIQEQLALYRALDERRATVLHEIEGQGRLTPNLRQAILPPRPAPRSKTYISPSSPSAAPAPAMPAPGACSPWPS